MLLNERRNVTRLRPTRQDSWYLESTSSRIAKTINRRVNSEFSTSLSLKPKRTPVYSAFCSTKMQVEISLTCPRVRRSITITVSSKIISVIPFFLFSVANPQTLVPRPAIMPSPFQWINLIRKHRIAIYQRSISWSSVHRTPTNRHVLRASTTGFGKELWGFQQGNRFRYPALSAYCGLFHT